MWWRRAVLPSLPWRLGFLFSFFLPGHGTGAHWHYSFVICVDFGFLFSFSRLVRSRQDTLQTSHTFTQSNHMPPRRRDGLRVAGGQSNATAAELLFGALERSELAAGRRPQAIGAKIRNDFHCPFSFFLSRAQCRASCEGGRNSLPQGARWGRCPPPAPGLAFLNSFCLCVPCPVLWCGVNTQQVLVFSPVI